MLVLVSGGFWADAQTSNTPPGPANYSSFGKFINERNIFNPNRYARAANTPYRPRTRTAVRRNSFALAGTMSYDEGETAGSHAFFDGSIAEYRKAAQTDGTIAIFKITAITADSVTLLLDTNTTVLKIGQHMRDEGQGRWSLSTNTISYAQNSAGGRRGNNGRRNDSGNETSSENTDPNAPDGVAMPDFGGDQGEPQSEGVEPAGDNNAPAEVTLPAGPVSDALRRLMELREQEEQSGNRN